MGVHYRKEVKVYQVILVLAVVFLIVLGMYDFEWMPALKQYAVLMSVTAAMAISALLVFYVISTASGVSGLKEGTKVTDEREKEY